MGEESIYRRYKREDIRPEFAAGEDQSSKGLIVYQKNDTLEWVDCYKIVCDTIESEMGNVGRRIYRSYRGLSEDAIVEITSGEGFEGDRLTSSVEDLDVIIVRPKVLARQKSIG